MKTASPYRLKLAMKIVSNHEGFAVLVFAECMQCPVEGFAVVVFAECMQCPVGKAPRASRNHLAALMFALEEFSRLECNEISTCTDVLQAWNNCDPTGRNQILARCLSWTGEGMEQKSGKNWKAADYFLSMLFSRSWTCSESSKKVFCQCQPEECIFGSW